MVHAGHDVAFGYLAELGLPMDMILQFCDNCASQYKSRRPFAELARCPLNIVRVYFGEKHGKNQCDRFFGQLKARMTHKIKLQHVVISNAHNFFRYCKEEYGSPRVNNQCQHYRVIFQFLTPSDIRCHHNCDLDGPIPGTRSIYSIRNMPHPLKLKVRCVPCLCNPCLLEIGLECQNSHYTDPWREVELILVKGDSTRKHQKRKHPKDYASVQRLEMANEENIPEEEVDMVVNDTDLPTSALDRTNQQIIDLTRDENQCLPTSADDIYIDLTDGVTNGKDVIDADENDDIIILNDVSCIDHPTTLVIPESSSLDNISN